MTTAAPSTALARIQPAFTDAERIALAGFPAGYRGLTRDAYALDLRQFTSWCRSRSLNLFAVRRAETRRSWASRGSQRSSGHPHQPHRSVTLRHQLAGTGTMTATEEDARPITCV